MCVCGKKEKKTEIRNQKSRYKLKRHLKIQNCIDIAIFYKLVKIVLFPHSKKPMSLNDVGIKLIILRL